MDEPKYTVDKVVSAAGRLWHPGEPITSARALDRIEEARLVRLDAEPDSTEVDRDDGEGWYNFRTVKTVLDGVGQDPDRAAYAWARELERDKNRQRAGVLQGLLAVAPDLGEATDDDGQDSDDDGEEADDDGQDSDESGD